MKTIGCRTLLTLVPIRKLWLIRPKSFADFFVVCIIPFMPFGVASAQCYQFSSGNATTLSITITNIPAPVIGSDGYGDTTWDYNFGPLTGNSARVTIGAVTASASSFSGPTNGVTPTFTIHIVSGPVASEFFLQMAAGSSTVNGLVAEIQLAATNETTPKNPATGLFPNGLPAIYRR